MNCIKKTRVNRSQRENRRGTWRDEQNQKFVILYGMRPMKYSIILSQLNEEERDRAYQKYRMIEPYINKTSTLKSISSTSGTPMRTLSLWVKKYRSGGLVGLARHSRSDKGNPRTYDAELQKAIEGIYLNKPLLSRSNIHRLIIKYCHHKNIKEPGYRVVCRIITSLPDDLVILGTQGTKAYQQKYDLIHIRSAQHPNEIWQADHCLIDIEVMNDKNKPQRPWLTIIMDDCSRAICSFLPPCAQKTSLCLRHAIWRKPDPQWNVLGVPKTLYTDHGSDTLHQNILNKSVLISK